MLMIPETASTPEGFLSVEIHAITAAKIKNRGAVEWRKPIHGTSVLVAADGSVLGHIRTLGILFPKAKRRYALRITGITFVRILPLISEKSPIRSDLAPYNSMKAAQKAGSELVERMIHSE